jgi:hypothetical protein
MPLLLSDVWATEKPLNVGRPSHCHAPVENETDETENNQQKDPHKARHGIEVLARERVHEREKPDQEHREREKGNQRMSRYELNHGTKYKGDAVECCCYSVEKSTVFD